MIYLELFWAFFKIGLFTFGGGYAMIPLIESEVVSHGWLTESDLLNMIGISESTPGPFAINIATFVGSTQGGFFGAVCTTFGVVLPSLIIIILIAMLMKGFAKNKWVQGAFSGIKPVVIGLILSTGLLILLSTLGVNTPDIFSTTSFSLPSLCILLIVGTLYFLSKRYMKKPLSPVVLIIISALLGALVFSV